MPFILSEILQMKLLIYAMEGRFHFYLKFCLGLFLFVLDLVFILFSTCKNERRREKYQGNFDREENFKEGKKKKGERKEWKAGVLPHLENEPKMTPFK